MQVSRKTISSSGKHLLPGILLLLAGLIFCFPGVAAAQEASIQITAPDASGFPTVFFYMEVAEEGKFVGGLEPGDVQVMENGREIRAATVVEQQPGTQVIVAFNLSPVFATTQGGSSLYQKVQSQLQAWAKAQPAQTTDDFTLIANERLLTIRQSDPARWVEELGAFQPEPATMKAGLSSLSQALDIATDPNPRPNMKRALIYITPPPADNNLSALPNLTQRVSQMALRVFVWVVVPTGDASGKGIDALQKLADSSGGQLFLYSGKEPLPDLEAYLQPLRSIYQVTYPSVVKQSGTQRIVARVRHDGMTRSSNAQEFQVDVQPPNPIFLEPPAVIQRKLTGNAKAGSATGDPESITLQILVEFPDGHPRPVTRSTLLVDGEVAAENKTAPFDRFTWNLAGYDSSQRHLIQARVEDGLGLSRTSMETAVDVQVESSRAPRLALTVDTQRLVVGGAVSVSALALVLVLWVSGRKGWLPGERRRRKRLLVDPVSQPVRIPQVEAARPNAPTGVARASWPLPSTPIRKAPAWLLQLNEDNQPVSGHTILFVRREMTFGSNAQMASCVLSYPGIDELHARLILEPDGSYLLTDAGSIAGTWVNFCPVEPRGVRLQHGDLVHFGQAAFRFEMAEPGPIRQPQVSVYEEQA